MDPAAFASVSLSTGRSSMYGGAPHHLRGGGPDAAEALRRQPEWDREIQTLDKEEKELHQSQLRLFREQTAAFYRDLAAAQGEIAVLKQGQQRLEVLMEELTQNHTRGFDLVKDAHTRLADEAAQHATSLSRRVEALERSARDKSSEMVAFRDQVMQLHSQQLDKFTEYLASEKRAREAQDRAAQIQLAGERRARELLEARVTDRLQMGLPGADSPRGGSQVQQQLVEDLVLRERKEREKQVADLRVELRAELKRAGGAEEKQDHARLDELLRLEETLREQQHAFRYDRLQVEEFAKSVAQEIAAEERGAWQEHWEGFSNKVDALQGDMRVLDESVQKESEERRQEVTRIWDALDNHTHDLTAQVIDGVFASGDPLGVSRVVQTMPVPSPAPTAVLSAPPAPMYPWAGRQCVAQAGEGGAAAWPGSPVAVQRFSSASVGSAAQLGASLGGTRHVRVPPQQTSPAVVRSSGSLAGGSTNWAMSSMGHPIVPGRTNSRPSPIHA